jgi:pyridoxal phosphate enzyme (YggS family)
MQFGENYLQEALPKIQALAKHKIIWHYIGPLQSNKTKKIAEHFDWVQSIDDFDIAKRLNDQRPEHLEPLNICLQIKISHEKAKSGMAPDHIFSVAEQCQNLPQLKLRGLMTIIEQKKDLADQREEFKQLVHYHEKLSEKGIKTDILSMGMSDDLEAAIAEGSTMVRIGTKIFGER